MSIIYRTLGAAVLALSATLAIAQDVVLKPFVLASTGPGDLTQKLQETKAALTKAGFTVAGSYAPYSGAEVIGVTDDELRSKAAKSEYGGFGAAMRVALTKVGDQVQVSYTNPPYLANAYRMEGDLQDTAAKLQTALGKVKEFGAKGLTPGALRKYHYMFGMEYFNEPNTLASYGSYEEALKAVEAGLAAGKQGVTKVYRVDLIGKQETLFGVAMKGEGDNKYMDDKYIMSEIDFKDVKSTAHLPYDILVSGNKVYAQYARFRIAISFPDLSMMGAHSFMNIMKAPEAIRRALALTVGGKEDAR
jgi:tetratricopeptide (TPR) repeat protein